MGDGGMERGCWVEVAAVRVDEVVLPERGSDCRYQSACGDRRHYTTRMSHGVSGLLGGVGDRVLSEGGSTQSRVG